MWSKRRSKRQPSKDEAKDADNQYSSSTLYKENYECSLKLEWKDECCSRYRRYAWYIWVWGLGTFGKLSPECQKRVWHLCNKDLPVMPHWMAPYRKCWMIKHIANHITRPNTMTNDEVARTVAVRDNWGQVQMDLHVFDSLESISIISFFWSFNRRVTQMPYTKVSAFGCYTGS